MWNGILWTAADGVKSPLKNETTSSIKSNLRKSCKHSALRGPQLVNRKAWSGYIHGM